jgi:hypothetical protein
MRHWLRIVPIVVLFPLAAACASASAKSADRPDLVIPPPPARVIPINAEPILEPVSDIPAPANAAPRPAARPPAARPSTGGETKPEAKPGEVKTDAPVEAPPAAPPANPPPAPQLRTAESGAVEAAVRASVERTRNLLSSIDYRLLSNERKKAYDDAKRFAQQAEDALKTGNTVFAQGVATKAETLAKELAGR